jgi:hypothetical protein
VSPLGFGRSRRSRDIFPLSFWMSIFLGQSQFCPPSNWTFGLFYLPFGQNADPPDMTQRQVPTFQIHSLAGNSFYSFILWEVTCDIAAPDLSVIWGSAWRVSDLDSCWLRTRFSLLLIIAVVHDKWTQALFHPAIGVLRLSSELKLGQIHPNLFL